MSRLEVFKARVIRVSGYIMLQFYSYIYSYM